MNFTFLKAIVVGKMRSFFKICIDNSKCDRESFKFSSGKIEGNFISKNCYSLYTAAYLNNGISSTRASFIERFQNNAML